MYKVHLTANKVNNLRLAGLLRKKNVTVGLYCLRNVWNISSTGLSDLIKYIHVNLEMCDSWVLQR